MASTAVVHGHIAISEPSVYAILDEEAKKAEQAALKFTRSAIAAAAPRGTGRHRWGDIHLADSFKYSVKRSPYGYVGQITRSADAWYGRIVERGRQPGVARSGRHYPGARANPFIERTMGEIENQAQALLEHGAERVAERLGALV